MAGKHVVLDLDATIARLEREAKALQDRVNLLKEIREEELRRNPEGAERAEIIVATEATGGIYGATRVASVNPAYAPKGTISGTEGAERYLKEVGESRPLVEIHRGALALGADVTYGALHAMMSDDAKKDAKKGKTFTRGPERGFFGLVEWETRK